MRTTSSGKNTSDTAAPMPSRRAPSAVVYARCGKISVRLAGPPLVRMSTNCRLVAVQIVDNITVVRKIVRSRGTVMNANCCTMEAPSISAASYSSLGIAWSPARKVIE